jgi:hypothetical protein
LEEKRFMARLSKAQRANIALAEVSVRLMESLIRLADTLSEKIDNADVLEPNIGDVEKMTTREALDTLHRCVKALNILEKWRG